MESPFGKFASAAAAARPQAYASQTPGIKHPPVMPLRPPMKLFTNGQAMQHNYQAANYSQQNAFNAAVASSLHAEKESFRGKNGNEKRVYLVVGPKQQQATIAFATDMRDALLRGYEENGVTAFSKAFTNLSEVQGVLEEMNILPPATSAATKKRRVPQQETQHDSNFADADEEGEGDELKVALEELYKAHRKLMESQQNLENVQNRRGALSMATASSSTTSNKPPPSMLQIQRIPATGLTTAAAEIMYAMTSKLDRPMSFTRGESLSTTRTGPQARHTYLNTKTSKSASSVPDSSEMHQLKAQQQRPLTCLSFNLIPHPKHGDFTSSVQPQSIVGGCELSALATAEESKSPAKINDETQGGTNSNSAYVTSNDNNDNPMATKNKKRPHNSSEKSTVLECSRWMTMYNELKKHKAKYGDCVVPRYFADNLRLASWVAEQRKQYRLRKINKPSNITVDRIRLLDELGFIWQAQSAAWNRHLNDLRSYKRENGDCLVPLNHARYPQLGLWVKEQRRHRSLMIRGRHSHMTKERVQILESVGFCWDSHEAAWWDKFQELQDYKEEFGDCMVPHRYAPNPQLSTWVHQQKRQIRLLKDGKSSHMSEKRAKALVELGFKYKRRKKKKHTITDKSNFQEETKEQKDQMTNSNGDEKKKDAESGSDSETESDESDVESEGEIEVRNTVMMNFVGSNSSETNTSGVHCSSETNTSGVHCSSETNTSGVHSSSEIHTSGVHCSSETNTSGAH
uniref:Helicase-associated domain-containing protein n=1 Tax=Ditylum brightwellii TaxID=49249 RepID=A0A7S4SG68_9STRA